MLSQKLLEACLPSQCLLCHLPSKQSLICHYCEQNALVERHYCQHCGCGLIASHDFCGECLKHQFKFQQLHAVAGYRAPYPALIKQLKYHNQLLYADLLGQLLASSIKQRYSQQHLQSIDYLIPVPLHPRKHRARGFNQAQLIAQSLNKHLGLTMLAGAVIRNKITHVQEGLSRPQRIRNLQNAFSLAPASRAKLQGKYVVLVDDVVTTGATINSLCQCISEASTQRVDVWCICRTELH